MNSGLFGDYYKYDLFIHHYDCDCFQAFYAYRNEIVNYKDLYSINFLKMNNSHL